MTPPPASREVGLEAATGPTDDSRLYRKVLIETSMDRRPTAQRVRTYGRDSRDWAVVATSKPNRLSSPARAIARTQVPATSSERSSSRRRRIERLSRTQGRIHGAPRRRVRVPCLRCDRALRAPADRRTHPRRYRGGAKTRTITGAATARYGDGVRGAEAHRERPVGGPSGTESGEQPRTESQPECAKNRDGQSDRRSRMKWRRIAVAPGTRHQGPWSTKTLAGFPGGVQPLHEGEAMTEGLTGREKNGCRRI